MPSRHAVSGPRVPRLAGLHCKGAIDVNGHRNFCGGKLRAMEPSGHELEDASWSARAPRALGSAAWGLKLVVFAAALVLVVMGVLKRDAISIMVGALILSISSLGFYTHWYGRKRRQ